MSVVQLPYLIVQEVVAISAIDRPALINRDPGPGETNVPIDSSISLQIVDSGPDGIDRFSTLIRVNGTLAFHGDLQTGFDGSRSEVTQSGDSLWVTLDPVVPLASQSTIEVHVISATNGGAHTLDETYTFSAEDKTAPRVVAGKVTGATTVQIEFDELVTVVDQQGFLFEPLEFPAVTVSPKYVRADDTIVWITLDTEITPDVRYSVSVWGVTDQSNNPVLPPIDTVEIVGFRPAEPAGRQFDMWKMLPKYNRRIDTTGDLRRFIDCLQEITDLLLVEVDRFPDIFDIERSPTPFLDLILQDLGNPFHFNLDELEKRRLASILVNLYRQKGTAIGLKNAIRFFLGLEIEVLPFASDTLILGESELGADWILGPSGRFALYAFNIEVDQVLTDKQRRQIRAIVNLNKPSHTHFVDTLESTSYQGVEHWALGESQLGIQTILS